MTHTVLKWMLAFTISINLSIAVVSLLGSVVAPVRCICGGRNYRQATHCHRCGLRLPRGA